jgi:uncharacterized protein YdeI (BOF family)
LSNIKENDMSNEDTKAGAAHDPLTSNATARRRGTRRAVSGVAAIAILALGVAGGAGAMRLARPNVEMAPMTPVAISSLPDGDLVTVKGRVAEIFGNKFVVEDGSGRALVETGPAGDNGKLVAAGEEVSVQGRFDDGFLHASFIVHPDGKTDAVGPTGKPPRHGPGNGLGEGPGDAHRPGPGAGPDKMRGPAKTAGPDEKAAPGEAVAPAMP